MQTSNAGKLRMYGNARLLMKLRRRLAGFLSVLSTFMFLSLLLDSLSCQCSAN